MEDRQYQINAAKSAVDFALDKTKSVGGGVVVAPTGSGKSFIIALIVEELFKRVPDDKIVLVIQPSAELLGQNIEKLRMFGVDAKIYSASFNSKQIGKVTYATPGSLKTVEQFKNKVACVIQDECHLGTDKTTKLKTFLKKIGITRPIGLTASPIYLNSEYGSTKLNFMTNSYRALYKKVIHCSQIQEMIAQKFWAKIRYDIVETDTSILEAMTTGQNFTEDSIDKFYEQENFVTKTIQKLEEYPGRKSIIIFVSRTKIADELANLIPGAVSIHGDTKKDIRRQRVNDFKNLRIRIVVTVLALAIGFDHPRLDWIIDWAPTNSFQLNYQKWGRSVRPHPDKYDALITDFAGNYDRFGKLEDITFENYKDQGWHAFTGDRLLTNVSLNFNEIVTKADLDQLFEDKEKERLLEERRKELEEKKSISKSRAITKIVDKNTDPKVRALELFKLASKDVGPLKFGKHKGISLYNIGYTKTGQPIRTGIQYMNWMYWKMDIDVNHPVFGVKNKMLKTALKHVLDANGITEFK